MIHIPNIKYSTINAGGSCDLPLFPKIDGGYYWSKFFGTACFDFDEAQCFAIEGDQIYFAGYLCSLTISPTGTLKFAATRR